MNLTSLIILTAKTILHQVNLAKLVPPQMCLQAGGLAIRYTACNPPISTTKAKGFWCKEKHNKITTLDNNNNNMLY